MYIVVCTQYIYHKVNKILMFSSIVRGIKDYYTILPCLLIAFWDNFANCYSFLCDFTENNYSRTYRFHTSIQFGFIKTFALYLLDRNKLSLYS